MTGNKIILEDIHRIIGVEQIPWNMFSGKTILITGANGFLPAYMVEVLLNLKIRNIIKDVTVLALVRNLEKAQRRFKEYLNYNFLQFVAQDVCQEISIQQKVHYIIHAASQASPKYYGIDPVGTLSANVLGTINLLKFAQNNPIESFLFFSSSEVYGEIENANLITENNYGYLDPTNVHSCYAESKRMGETICISWFKQYNIPVKIIRPFHTYGPGMALDDGRVFADFVSDIVNKNEIMMKSNGEAYRTFCYLADATEAFFIALLKGDNGEAYNVGNPACEVSILELAQILINIYPERNIKLHKVENNNKKYLINGISRNCPNILKISNLGWKPTIDLIQGFSRTISSYD